MCLFSSMLQTYYLGQPHDLQSMTLESMQGLQKFKKTLIILKS